MPLPTIVWRPSPNFNTPAQTPIYYGVPRAIRYICIHWWDDPAKKPTFDGVVNVLCKLERKASAHYVAEDGRITRLVDEENTAWACGSGNPETINIECNPRQTDADYQIVAELIADIRRRRGNLPLVPHNRYAKTTCPGTYNLGRLDSMATVILNPPPPPVSPPPPPEPTPAPAPVPEPQKPPESTPTIPPVEKPSETSPSEPQKPSIESPKGVSPIKEFLKRFWEIYKEGIKEGLRYFLAYLAGAVLTFASDYVTGSQIDPTVKLMISGMIGSIIKGIDKNKHESEPTGVAGGLFKF